MIKTFYLLLVYSVWKKEKKIDKNETKKSQTIYVVGRFIGRVSEPLPA